MKWPRIEEITFYKKQKIVEVRSRPLWVVVIERWFLEVHWLINDKLGLRVPERIYKDSYWGEPFEAAFHHFYTWTLNERTTIDKSASYAHLNEKVRRS